MPANTELAFFTYGLFRHGQLGYLRLRQFVARRAAAEIGGLVVERDGLPILDVQEPGAAEGTLLWFADEAGAAAYTSIAELEPDAQYRWDVRDVRSENGVTRANVLVGKRPRAGSAYLGEPWDGRRDPLFNAGLEVIEATLAENAKFEWAGHPLFRLQMAYLLLFAAIERYAALRHLIGGGPGARIAMVGGEPAFAEALRRVVSKGNQRAVFSVEDPKDRYRLDPDDPKASMLFYYQIRNNSAHRGKAAFDDFLLVRESLEQLLSIFKSILKAAFADAER